ncbi:MAG: FecR domain-containing protein [Candidatus Riflebacteria bacterium]|nr:FecR domain-containing protein [Candidatus Riflebacteria bacterium]
MYKFKNTGSITKGFLVAAIMAAFSVFSGCGSNSSSVSGAVVKEPKGDVQAKVSSDSTYKPIKENDILSSGGAVKTAENSTVKLLFAEKAEVYIKPESYFEIKSGENLGKQMGGTAVYRVNKQKDSIKIETPQGVTAVLGTVFLLDITSTSTTLIVEEGKVSFTNIDGLSTEVNPGEKLVAAAKGKSDPVSKLDPIAREKLFNPGGSDAKINQH